MPWEAQASTSRAGVLVQRMEAEVLSWVCSLLLSLAVQGRSHLRSLNLSREMLLGVAKCQREVAQAQRRALVVLGQYQIQNRTRVLSRPCSMLAKLDRRMLLAVKMHWDRNHRPSLLVQSHLYSLLEIRCDDVCWSLSLHHQVYASVSTGAAAIEAQSKTFRV